MGFVWAMNEIHEQENTWKTAKTPKSTISYFSVYITTCHNNNPNAWWEEVFLISVAIF